MLRARSILTLAMLGSAAVGTAARAAPPPRATLLAHPARTSSGEERQGWERAQVNAACESCHVEIAAEWRESRHRAAFTNGPFQRSLSREEPLRRPFCQSCHAPEADPMISPTPMVASMGVGCVTCHAPLGPVLAAPGHPDAAPHSLFRTAAFAGDGACAGCHEFAFPGRSGEAGLLMQSTVTEHLVSAESRTCASCHMPVSEGQGPHRSHRFPGGYDESMVKGALTARAERTPEGRVRLTLTKGGITHAMPTGDLFRRLAVETAPAAGGAPLDVFYLARHFTRGGGMHQSRDDRIHDLPTTLDIDAPPGPLLVRVRYERVGHHVSPDEREAVVESAVPLADLPVP